jgi:serine/threonine-protein kinase HipA
VPAHQIQLAVFAHLEGQWAPAGLLKLTEDAAQLQASEFAYGLRYVERPNALEVDPVSLSLADRESVKGVVLNPPNALPLFGGIRDAAPDAWGRRVIEAKLRAPANSLPESTYLLHAGSHRVGALDVRTSIHDSPSAGMADLHSLQYLMEAAERIEAGEPVPARLDAIFAGGTALGGARPKASVCDEQGVLWLAKFSSTHDPLNVPQIEAATLRLAAECGLTVPPVHVVEVGHRQVMLIRRFDRYWTARGEAPAMEQLMQTAPGAGLTEGRLAFVSGLTLLACDETESRTKSYADLARAIRRYCHTSVIRDNNRELFGRMVYNILVSNDDDHLRNHGFVRDAQIGGWRLSPLYDVMPRPSVSFERQQHLGVGAQGRSATLDNALTQKEAFNLSDRDACEIISRIARCVRQWQTYFEQYGVAGKDIDTVATAFRRIEDVVSPELRKRLP